MYTYFRLAFALLKHSQWRIQKMQGAGDTKSGHRNLKRLLCRRYANRVILTVKTALSNDDYLIT